MQFPRRVTVRPVRRDERSNGNGRAVRKQLGHFGNAADVLVAVFLAEAQVLVQSKPDVVTVQAVGGDFALAEQLVLEFDGDCGLAAGGQAGEPDCEATLVAQGGALSVGDAAGVEGYVSFVG